MSAIAKEVWVEIDQNVTRRMSSGPDADRARQRLADGEPVELIVLGERCEVLSIEPQFEDGEMFYEVQIDRKVSFAFTNFEPEWASRAQEAAQQIAAGEEAFIVFGDDDERIPILAMWTKIPSK